MGVLIGSAGVGEAAAPLLQDEDDLEAYIQRLVEHEEFADAVRVLAHALPTREAIWWAWVCARRASGEDPAPKIKTALDATERWIRTPNDENRRQAMAAAEIAEFGTPAGCAALAAFFSGGSLAPPNVEPVPPPDHAAAKAIAGSVIISAVIEEPEKAPAKFREFIAQGMTVAKKLNL
jgi:hypothetical protein